jgi:two-component system sensor histidine kinase PilS (NtrC family)
MSAGVNAPPPRLNSPGYFASHWRSLDYFNLYRLTLALALVLIGLVFGESDLFKSGASDSFKHIAIAYLLCAALLVLGIRARWPSFQIQLTAHIMCDIVFVILMMGASDRLASGLGLLLVISIASGGLVGSGRLTLLYAALASIAVLLQHSFSILADSGSLDSFLQIGLLCMGYFATGLLAHTLTQRALRSETLAAAQAQELALLNRINALAIANSPDGIVAINADDTVRHANPRALSLLRVGAPQPGRTPLADFAPILLDELQRCRLHLPASDAPLLTPSGRLRVRCIPLGSPDGNVVLILEDLTQAEQAAQRLKLAALGRLTANIAHEIRNPLSAISHAAQLLLEDAADPSQARLPELIEKNARRLDRLVQDVLSLNRRDRIHPEAITPAALTNLLEDLRETEEIPTDAVIVNMHTASSFCFDPDHLRQIMWNLLKNAWRHSQQRTGSVCVDLSDAGQQMYLEIHDDGAGVAAEHQPKLFEPFFTTDSRGTGLGLFLARELCEANGAALTLVPSSSGATFRVSARKGEC